LLSRITGDQEITALVPEAEYFTTPHHPGDQIGLHWDAKNLHQLTA
jgi:putative spermidine/putrescine transport system ATP-binding protein